MGAIIQMTLKVKIQAFQGGADSQRPAFGWDPDKVQYLVEFS